MNAMAGLVEHISDAHLAYAICTELRATSNPIGLLERRLLDAHGCAVAVVVQTTTNYHDNSSWVGPALREYLGSSLTVTCTVSEELAYMFESYWRVGDFYQTLTRLILDNRFLRDAFLA